MKLWSVAKLDKTKAGEIQSRYELPAIVAMLLQIRNITTKDEIEGFLYNDSFIADPFEIKDMDKAVERINKALDCGEPICVYGDYDADGVTSTALLYSYLETIDANAMYYIPSRETEGYGMNKNAVDKLNERGIKLIITVDNGIAAAQEVAYASSLGIDTVVTDHHMPSGELPKACAVVDLHREDCKSRFKNLSGVGVAFKLIMALEGEYCDTTTLLDNYSDLLSIGTIGDVVELKDENRVFVKHGLESITNTDRPGLQALIKNSGLTGKTVSSTNVSFTIVPRINAVGRLGLSEKSVSLLLTEDYDDKIIVIAGENWHQGVIGLIAAKVKEAYGKPAIVISKLGDIAKGSGRSVEGFPLCDAVFACSDLLTHRGGHPMAVGLSLDSENIPAFRRKINEFADNFGKMPYDKINIECKLNPAYINLDLIDSLSLMQPYGAGNPTPVFGLYNMTLKNITPLSANRHLRLTLSRNNIQITAMKFFTSTEEFPYKIGETLDLAVNLDRNEFNGNVSVSVIVKDIKSSDCDTEKLLDSRTNYEDFCRGKQLDRSQLSDLMPDRNDFALLYRYLKSNGGYAFETATLAHMLDNRLSFGKIKVILEAMRELRLIEISEGMKTSKISVLPVNGRVDLESAPIIKKLREVF